MRVAILKKRDLLSSLRGDFFVVGKQTKGGSTKEERRWFEVKEKPRSIIGFYQLCEEHTIDIIYAGLELVSITRYCLLCMLGVCILAYFICHRSI